MQNKSKHTPDDNPNPFVAQHQSEVIGVLSGLDRLRFKGTLPVLYTPRAMECFLSAKRLLFTQFKDFATGLTQRIKAAAADLADRAQRPFTYLKSCHIRKEEQARQLIRRDGLTSGLVAVFGCVEACQTFALAGNPQTRKLEFKLQPGRCQHFYFYHLHPEFGLMHLRLQSWFPFQVEVCLNGRQWLARQMDRQQLKYRQQENCFPWIDQIPQAQRLLDEQLQRDWPRELDQILRQNHPLAEEICAPLKLRYYWTTKESEYATDVMFASPKALRRIYPTLVRHSITSFGSGDVMRFLGHRVCANGEFQGELVSDYKKRPEGIRVKHRLKANSIKMYDQQGSILRIETTINDPGDFRVYRAPQARPGQPPKEPGQKTWLPRRRGVADFKRRAEVSHASNQRFLTALSATEGKTPLSQAVNRGEFKLNGFRNRDLRALLFKATVGAAQRRRQAAKVTRQLTLLRAHGLIKKVPRTHHYVLTDKGSQIITALITARHASINDLIAIAA